MIWAASDWPLVCSWSELLLTHLLYAADLTGLYPSPARLRAAGELGHVPPGRAGVVVARLDFDLRPGGQLAVHGGHGTLKLTLHAEDLGFLDAWKKRKSKKWIKTHYYVSDKFDRMQNVFISAFHGTLLPIGKIENKKVDDISLCQQWQNRFAFNEESRTKKHRHTVPLSINRGQTLPTNEEKNLCTLKEGKALKKC